MTPSFGNMIMCSCVHPGNALLPVQLFDIGTRKKFHHVVDKQGDGLVQCRVNKGCAGRIIDGSPFFLWWV